MKVKFDSKLYKFHDDHYRNLKREIVKRGHEIVEQDADFLVIADEEYNPESSGVPEAKCIWIGHSFDAKGACLNSPEALAKLEKNADYLFVYSKWYQDWLGERIKTKSFITGMTKLDGLSVEKDWKKPVILYAPTFNEELSSEPLMEPHYDRLRQIGELIVRPHPAMGKDSIDPDDAMKRATVVISDYSSVGFEAIALNIPTVFINHLKHKSYKTFPPDEYITNQARKAAMIAENFIQVLAAVLRFISEPKHLEVERLHYSELLNQKFFTGSAVHAVQIMELIHAGRIV